MNHSDTETGMARSIVRGPGEGRRIPLGEAGEVVLKAEGADRRSLTIYEFSMPPATGPPNTCTAPGTKPSSCSKGR